MYDISVVCARHFKISLGQVQVPSSSLVNARLPSKLNIPCSPSVLRVACLHQNSFHRAGPYKVQCGDSLSTHSHPSLNATMRGTTPQPPLSWDFRLPDLSSVTVKRAFKPVIPPGARDRPMEVTREGLPISMTGAFDFVRQIFLPNSPYLYVDGFDPYMCMALSFISYRRYSAGLFGEANNWPAHFQTVVKESMQAEKTEFVQHVKEFVALTTRNLFSAVSSLHHFSLS
jgi:hypothetical protein